MTLQGQLPVFQWITQYTPVIPKIYWDVYSAEERMKWLTVEYDRILHYLIDIANHINDTDTDAKTKLDAIQNHLDALDTITTELKTQIGKITDELPTYNPTKGKYENSQNTNRDMYRELAVFGARVADMATLTTAEAAKHTTLEMAAIGNYTVFGQKEPRITPVDTHKEKTA